MASDKIKVCKVHGPLKNHQIVFVKSHKGPYTICRICRNFSRRKSLYGITEAEYNEMLLAQNNVCKICKRPEWKLNRKFKEPKALSIDHCHKTGKIRGLLCSKCNSDLGYYKENIFILEMMIEYVKAHS